MNWISAIGACALGLGLTTAAFAAEVSESVRTRIVEAVRAVAPQTQVGEIRPAPLPNLYEVILDGQVYYVSADGRHMLQGELLELNPLRSLTEVRRGELRLAVLKEIPTESMLIYPAKGPVKHRITVVTDIDCPYCRAFHRHMPELNAQGVEVRYLLWPRAGVRSESYEKAVSVWCADKPLEAMTLAKQEKPVPRKECANPVTQHMAYTQRMGVTGTPAILTENGSLIPGYMPPAELLNRLQTLKSQPAK